MLDHRDDIGKRSMIANLMGLLKILSREAVPALHELLTQLIESRAAPVPWAVQEDADGFDLRSVLRHEAGERFKILLWLVFVTATVPEEPLRVDAILNAWGDVEDPLRSRI